MAHPKFEIFKSSSNSQYYFRLTAANGEKILGSEGYGAKDSCKDGIESVKKNSANDSRYEKHEGKENYSFALKAANGEVIGRSESYKSASGRDNGIESVKKNAAIADIEDASL